MRTTAMVAIAVAILLLAAGTPAAGERTARVMDFDGDLGDFATDQEDHSCLAPSTAEALLDGDVNVPATCDNGDYIRYGFSMGHGFSLLPYTAEQWTGHVESWLRHAGDDRGFRCTFDNGALVGCQGLGGAFPGVGAEFSHECLAYESLTNLELPIALTNWGCRVFGEITRIG